METVIILQIGFILLIFVTNIVCVFIPIRFFNSSRKGTSSSSRKLQRVIDLCNSISAGVFLGTCYIQLIPYVEEKFTEIFVRANLDLDYSGVTSQCLIMAGFFLILIIEQTVHACQHSKHSHDPPHQVQMGNIAKPVSTFPNGYEASSDSSETLDSDNDDPKQSMLKSTKKQAGAKFTISEPSLSFTQNNHYNHGHADSHCSGNSGGGGGGHGHSHVIDLVQDPHSSALRCILLLAALSCHSFFEGVAVGLQDSVARLVNLFIGVIIHEALVAFAIGISLAKQTLKRSLIIQLALVFSLMIPVGMIIGLGLGEAHGLQAEFVSAILQAIAAGTFVYVVFLEVLPIEINAKQDKFLRILFVFIGFALILCLRLGLRDN